MEFVATAIPGCYEARAVVHADDRGMFAKPFQSQGFRNAGLESDLSEVYYSLSHRRVLRGMHFQTPPHDHAKLVCCVQGEVLDSVVDLRVGSPTFGQHAVFRLDAKEGKAVYVPRGVAHGFYVTGRDALMLYCVTSAYSPEHDQGVRWDTLGLAWPDRMPIVSPRDQAFPSLAEFRSPFSFE